jgi:predicted  nucleic acid-binding Zn-ribbon protein
MKASNGVVRILRYFSPRIRECWNIDHTLAIASKLRAEAAARDAQPDGFSLQAELDMLKILLNREPEVRQVVETLFKPLFNDYRPGPAVLVPLLDDLMHRLQIRRMIVDARGFFSIAPTAESTTLGSEPPRDRLQVSAPKLDTSRNPSPRSDFNESRSNIAATEPDVQSTHRAASGQDSQDTAEAALLWRLAEQNFRSWPFRAAALLLIMAAVLAFGGNIYLGSETIKLRDQLDKDVQTAENDLAKSLNAAKENVGLQVTMVKNQFDAQAKGLEVQKGVLDSNFNAVNDQQKQLAEKIASGRQEIGDKIADFKKQADDLPNQAVQRLVDEFANKHPELISKVASQIDEALHRIPNDDLRKLQDTVNAAGGVAAAVREGAGRLTSELGRLATQVKELGDDVSRKRAEFAVAAHDLDDLTALESKTKQANARIDGVEKTAGDLKARVKALSDKLSQVTVPTPAPTPVTPTPPSRTEDSLNHDEKVRIQRALANRGFSPRGADGQFGSRTRRAIIAFQASIKAPHSGVLTSEQIKLLLEAPAAQR